MKKIIVYLFIALSLLSLGLTLPPNVFAQTPNIKVINYSYYISPLGYLDVVGEIQNVGANTIDKVTLAGYVFSTDGTLQSNSMTQALVAYLVPQQIAPFAMEFSLPANSPNGGWDSLVYNGDIANVTFITQGNETNNYQYPDLKITSSSATIVSSGDSNGAYEVNGTILNTGNEPATGITVVGAFFNATGTVIAIGYTNYLTPNTLSPSGTVTFQINAFDLNQTQASSNEKITSYSLLVQTQSPILQGTPPAVTPYIVNATPPPASESSSPSPSSLPTATASQPNNNVPNTTIIVAVIVVIAILVGAGAIFILSKRKPNETVKQRKKARNNSD